jgi:hypothetical protein
MMVVLGHREATLGHHFHEVSQAQLEPKIPADAQNDDFAVEVSARKQLFQVLQLAHRRLLPLRSQQYPLTDFVCTTAVTMPRGGQIKLREQHRAAESGPSARWKWAPVNS